MTGVGLYTPFSDFLASLHHTRNTAMFFVLRLNFRVLSEITHVTRYVLLKFLILRLRVSQTVSCRALKEPFSI